MKHLKEKAEYSANWSYRLVIEGFSIYKTLKELIEKQEEIFTKLSFEKNESLYQFTEIVIYKLKEIEKNRSYYRDQLSRINMSSDPVPKIKIKHSDIDDTNWLDLNDQCMDVLIEWINEKRHKL